MKCTLTSITGIHLDVTQCTSLYLCTQEGDIVVLPNHEHLVTALVPGPIRVEYETTWHQTYESLLGGGVAEITPDHVRILADMVEDGWHDLEALRQRKLETEKKLAELRAEGTISMEAFIELEQEYMKDQARERYAIEHTG